MKPSTGGSLVRNRAITTIAVCVTAGALVLSGCSSSKKNNGGGLNNTNSNTAKKSYTIGFVGALSGDYAQLGINEKQGAQLAIDQANASGKYDFKVTLDAEDSQ